MDIELFDYELPEELIAQKPLPERDQSRLLVLDRHSGKIEHRHFYEITAFLNPGDCLVFNDSRVIPARLIGEKEETGAGIELLLLRKTAGNDQWEALARPAKRIREGTIIRFGGGKLLATCVAVGEEGLREFRFEYQGLFDEVLEELGEMPLPPYIHEKLEEKERYQTVYAKNKGSAAAPTAGLHFTEPLLEKIRAKGIHCAFLTLHVGLGTFRPVTVKNVKEHQMHSEFYHMSEKTAQMLEETKQRGGKIVAVGTTVVRTLETIAHAKGQFAESSGWTDIFIYPGHTFKGIDAMLTNFHLPKSTLLMLVSAFAGREKILNSYREAVRKQYRFFSFGDAMLITERGS